MSNPTVLVTDPPPPPTPEPGKRVAAGTLMWLAFAAILIGEVLDLLDSLVTTIAGPSIVRDLGGSDALLQWLSAGYTLALAGGVLVGGRLGDRLGRRRLFLAGMCGFMLASLVAAVASGPEMLLAARLAQGLLGALMLPQSFGLIREVVPQEWVGKAFGIFGVTMALAAIAGPLVAGVLVEADIAGLGWRMIFLINLPLGLVGLVAGRLWLPRSTPDPSIGVDVVGCVLAVLAMVAFTFPLVEGRELGWPWWCWAMLAAAVALVAVFVRQQRMRAAAGRDVLVVPSLLGKTIFTGGLTISFAFFTAFTSSSFILAVLLQVGLGLSPGAAALTGVPQALGMVLGLRLASRLLSGRRQLVAGFAVGMVGLVALIAALLVAPASTLPWWLAPGLLTLGMGVGAAMGPIFEVITEGLEEHEVGSASGLLNTAQQVGMAVGVAALGSVIFAVALPDGGAAGYQSGAAWAFGVALVLMAVALVLTRRLLPDLPTTTVADSGAPDVLESVQ